MKNRINKIKASVIRFSHWARRTASAIKRLHEFNSDIISAANEIEEHRKQIGTLEFRIELLEERIEEIDNETDLKIANAIDDIDIQQECGEYVEYSFDPSEHIDYDEIAQKSIEMMVERLQQTV